MADKKISELVELTSLATDDVLPVVDTGSNATKRITAANLSKFPAGVTIPDGSTIGSASDPDAMSIAAGGDVTFSQNIKMAAGKGIDFSAYGSGVDSNLLDDYEEGTWTPAYNTVNNDFNLATEIKGAGASYVRVGKMVSVNAYISTDGTTPTGTGALLITGLPFIANRFAGVTFDFRTGWVNYAVSASVSEGFDYLVMRKNPTGAATQMTVADMSSSDNDNQVLFSFTYTV